MKNPCKQCIVNPMCQQECDPFIEYINKTLENPILDSPGFVAKQIRNGRATLTKNGLIWTIGDKAVWKLKTHAKNAW